MTDPTPETFRRLAEWAEDPKRSRDVEVTIIRHTFPPGYLLRRIADAYQEAEKDEE